MASGGAEEDDGGIPLDIDNVHMLLQVEHEQIQKRTFTNWINAQLSKRCPPTFVSDLFSDLKDGSHLLDLLEVMTGQPMKRQRGRGVFQQRANIDTALNFLKKKSVKLVNINIPDIIDGRPSIILGLIWTIILHCHIEELASTLSYSSCHSSLDSLTSLDSYSSSPIPASPVPAGRTSPLHRRFRLSAKKALLMWVRDQCQRVGCSLSVKDFKKSWRSGEAFLAILCSLRPQLVDLSLVKSRSNIENLEEVFHLAERELHIPRLLEPQDVDVKDPDEKSIMTYVAQFLQYSNDMPSPDDHLQLFPLVEPSSLPPLNLSAHFAPAFAVSPLRQVPPSERAKEVTSWLQQTHQELLEARTATENSSFAEKYQAFQRLADSFTEQRKPVMTLLAAIKRCPELNQEQRALRAAWDHLEEEMQRYKADLDLGLPPPLDSVVMWLQHAEAALTEEGGKGKDHADAAKDARTGQDQLKTLMKEMSRHVNTLDTYKNMDNSGNVVVPLEKFDEVKRRLTDVRVTAKYQGIKLEYQESRHTVLDLLGRLHDKVQAWKAPYRSQETVIQLLQDWHETVERQGLLLILVDALQNLKEKLSVYTSKAALSEDSQLVTRQVKEAESEAAMIKQAVTTVKGMMERVVSAWVTYYSCMTSLQTWLARKIDEHDQDMSERASCQAKLNEAGNLLIEVTESSTSRVLAEQLSKVNMQWAERMKKKFEAPSESTSSLLCPQMVHSLTQEASLLLIQPLEVATVPVKATRKKLQLLSKKMTELDPSTLSPSKDSQIPQMLVEAEQTCEELQRAASIVEGHLAELDRWSTEAMDCYLKLKEKEQRGRPALESQAKFLISRGSQLENQVVTEGQDLQDLVERVQTTSPLQHLSTSAVQDRISEAVAHCQEILEMFSPLGYQRPRQTQAGSIVVARTKHVDQVENVLLKTQDPNQVSAEFPSQVLQQRTTGLQNSNSKDQATVVMPLLPKPLVEPVPELYCPPPQTEYDTTIPPQSVSTSQGQATGPRQSDQPSSTSPVLHKPETSPVSSERGSPSPSQPNIYKARIRSQTTTPPTEKKPPLPPLMDHSEVHSKAQSMAKSRLLKARSQLQGRIQQAIQLFGGRELSGSQVKKKQRALKVLQPTVLEEFLGAVEGFGAFCTEPQLQELMLLSESVRKQWEDVCRDMSAFVPVLWSKIREGKQPVSAMQCETQNDNLHDAHDRTHPDCLMLQQQAVMDEAASVAEQAELLQELGNTLTQTESACLTTDELRESDNVQETRSSARLLQSDSRGLQLRVNTLLRATGTLADTQQSDSLPQKQCTDSPQQELSPMGGTVSAQPCSDTCRVQAHEVPAESEDDLRRSKSQAESGRALKPALRAKEQQLTARLLHITESKQPTQTQIQTVVRGNTVETKQEPEWTVIPESAAQPQEEDSVEQEALERYRKSCSEFETKLQKNKQLFEDFIPEPVNVSNLQNHKKQLETLKQETAALWLECEFQHARLSRSSQLITRRDKGEAVRGWEQLTQQWRDQQMCLQSRMTSLENTADLLESADAQIDLMTEKLDRLIRKPVDISLTLTEPGFVSDLQEIDDSLQSELKKLSDEERWRLEATFPSSLYQAFQNNVHHLKQLRQRLEKVQTAARALDHFLISVREVNAEIPKQDPDRQQNEADREKERRSWQQKLQTAAEQADGTLKAAGMTLNMDGSTVKCQDVVTSLSSQAVEQDLIKAKIKEILLIGLKDKQESEDLNTMEIHQMKIWDDSHQQEEERAKEQEHSSPSVTEEESELEDKKSRLEGENETNVQKEKEQKTQTVKPNGEATKVKNGKRRRGRSSQIKREEEERESLDQRRAALLGALKEIKGAAEQLGLQEATLPALQQRKRALKELQSRLSDHLSELQKIQAASLQSGVTGGSQTREEEEVMKETMKAANERLEQCNVSAELLKRFQIIRGELSGTLQRAEGTISEQASYMGKDNLQRLHTKVQDSKAELNGLGDRIEEVRSVCRQLHTHLRQIPGCTIIPFDAEADALMDRWLDISERTDSHLENLHLGLTLWEGVLHLGAEVELWTSNKLSVFAESPSFQTEEDITALQNEISTQEENMERFHRKAAEIQVLLQNAEAPLELQVVETQMRKKIEQLKELASEAEDVYRQTVAAKGQISARMADCSNSLQKIQDSLLTLSGSDVTTVLAKLKDFLFELQTQDEQAESVLEDLRVISSIASSVSLQGLSTEGVQLQEKVRDTHQLFSQVEEQTERSIQVYDRLKRESEQLERWLQTFEEKAANAEDLRVLQEEELRQRVRTDDVHQLVLSLQNSSLRQCALVGEGSKLMERYNNFLTRSLKNQCPLSKDLQTSQTLSQPTVTSAGDLRQTVDSSPAGNTVPSAMAEEEAHLGKYNNLEDGVSNEEHLGSLMQDFQQKLTSMQKRLSECQLGLAAQITDAPTLLALLQEITDMEEELLHIATLKDSIIATPTAEAQASLSQQVSNLQDHKRGLEDSIRQNLAQLTENRNQRVEQAEKLEENPALALNESPPMLEGLHPPASLSHPAADHKENCTSDQNDNKIKAGDILETDNQIPDLDVILSENQKQSQQTKTNLLTHPGTKDNDGTSLGSGCRILPGSKAEKAQLLHKDTTFTQDPKLSATVADTSTEFNPEPSITAFVESTATKSETAHPLTLKNLPEPPAAQSETFKAAADSPKKVITIVLEMEPRDIQVKVNTDLDRPGCSRAVTSTGAASSAGIPEDISGLSPVLISPKSNEIDWKIYHSLALTESQVAESISGNSLQVVTAEQGVVKPASACSSFQDTHEVMYDDVLNSSKPCGIAAERQLIGACAAGTTLPDVRSEEMTDFCLTEEQTMSSVLCRVEGDTSAETQIPASDTKQQSVAQSAGTGLLERDKGEDTSDLPDGKVSKIPEDDVTLQFEGSEWTGPASLEDTKDTQLHIQEGMEPEKTAPGLRADLQATKMTGGSEESCKPKSTMQDILTEIQSLVERSNIINRTPHIDLNWYLKSSPGESEIRLIRTVQKVLACRYQPAQLDISAMVKQLQEAEDFRRCVQDQVAALKSVNDSRTCSPDTLKSVEGQCSAALLDASATVQVKAAQLDQVKQYQKQMKIIRAFLAVVAVEKEKMNLDTVGSSALQAGKLHGLLQTMLLKKGLMEELLHRSSQLSVHLSDAESSGALLAQLGDIQEEWRLLEGSIKRGLQHASSSTSQSSLLIKDTKQLKAKLEALQTSDCESSDNKSALEVVCLTTDLKLYNQLYLHLQSESEALVHFSLGQKEKDEIKRNLQEVGSLLNLTKSKLDISTHSSPARINKQLRDLITWAKQAENHISIGKKLALFPEEARIQIMEMKKFQTDIWSRRSKLQAEVEQMKDIASGMEKEESDQVFRTVEDLYEAIADSLDHVLATMKKSLIEREKMLCQLSSMDAWLAETHAKRDPCVHMDNVSKADIRELESELKSHKFAKVKIESTIKLVEEMAERCKEIAAGLSPGESRYIVNRLSGLWTELDGLLAFEKATSWELEELIHERRSSDEELSTVQASLNQISSDLAQQKFPLTQETLSKIALLKHMLMEHQCQVQELQHCQEAKRSSLLCTIGELQDQCKAFSINTFEQEKYLHLRSQMEESRDIAAEQIQRAKDKGISLGQRFRQCQILLVELPLVKTQCQEAADQLEAIAQELNPTELNAERQRIHQTVETLVSREDSVTEDIKNLEAKLLLGLRFSSELPALVQFFRRAEEELQGAKPVNPEERAIDVALRRCWVIWRNMESGIRVLEGLGRREKVNLNSCKELYSLRDVTMQECHERMASLAQARESLKDYQWAAQGAIGFLHNAEATFLSAPGGFLDCTEEQKQTQQALEALEDGFQAHISHLLELVPQQPCLSQPETEKLHISIFSQLLVGRAVLEAQAQLRLESLQRCEERQQSHRMCHEDICQRLSGLEAQLSECAAEQVTSYDKCVAQQKRAKLLMDDLRSLAVKIEDLRAGCPMQGCGVGKDGELGALWRRWVSLRRGIGLLMAHTEQRGEEWKDITTSMEQCCSFLASLQAEVPDSSAVSFTQEKPQELLAQAEMHQAGLEQEQQALASLEHRLEHALSLSSSQDPISPGPVGKTLVKIQENVRSLKERNLQVVAAAQAEEKERQQIQEDIEEVEQHVMAILTSLEACSNRSKQQELRKDLLIQKTKLKCIVDSVQRRYGGIPADISRMLQGVQLSLRRDEEKLIARSIPLQKLNRRVVELGSGLEKVKMLLDQKSPTVPEAQHVLKRVWDELDAWHSRLMILESEVQDLAEEHPDQAHILMDQLTQPLQLYQNTAQQVEQRTAFLSKIPSCLQEFEDTVHSATCWLDEAQSWLSAPCSFTTARSLQNHANSLQLVLDDSERIRSALQDFRPVLDEISAVCDMRAQVEKLDQNDQKVHKTQSKVLEPLEQLLEAVDAVEDTETELKTMEKNVQKIRAILSSMDNSNITLTEHLQNRQVILANVQSMQRTLEEMEKCKGDLKLPRGAEESLLVFSRAKLLLQQLKELEQLTQQQTTLLEEKIKEEDLDINEVSKTPNRSAQMSLVQQEAFELSNSEEEEDEEKEGCHSSSSSDTLTCSIPEDPEETFSATEVQSEENEEAEPLSEVKKLGSLTNQTPPNEEMCSKAADTSLLFSKSDLNSRDKADSGLITLDSQAVSRALPPENAAAESLVSAAEDEDTAPCSITVDRPKHETTNTDHQTKPPQEAAAVEDTRLIPARPVTPFTASRTESEDLTNEGDKDQSMDSLQDQSETVEESKPSEESPEMPISSAGKEEEDTEQLKWSRLYNQISQKLTTLKKVKEEHEAQLSSKDGVTHEKYLDREMSSGSASAVLHRTHESVATLRQMVSSAAGSNPGVNKELYEAARKVLLSLDALTDLLLTSGVSGEDDPKLKLIQHECVSAELNTVSELLTKVESDIKPALSSEEPEALGCMTSLQECLQIVQLVCASSKNQIIEHLGITAPHQELPSDQLCILDECEPGEREIFPSTKDTPSLECVLGRHLREGPGEKDKLQQASRSLLQGTIHLLELGEECIRERQMNQVHNRGQLQAVLCRHKKLLQVLRSQSAFVQQLFQREPAVLQCQEDECVQLEVRTEALQQQALEHEVAFQRRLQEWTQWEDNCGELGRLLDDVEALISGEEPEGDDEKSVLDRLALCQQTLVQLEESRATVGLLLDQRKMLQTDPALAATVCHKGGALELRWRSAYRWMEQEIQRCRDIQDSQTRFQTNFASVCDWLVGANKRLKNWSNLANTSDPNSNSVNNSLMELLDFSMEVGSMSVKKASVSREASQLFHLRETDCPRLRAQLSQMGVTWSQLTSDLSKIQDKLQQCLLSAWPPLKLLCDLDDWLQKQEARLNQKKEAVLKAEDAAQITEVLQQYQELKAGMVNGQHLLDFLCQSGPQMMGADVLAHRSERTMFAETLGTLGMKWLLVQRELENQLREAEQLHQTCADRERRLQRLHGFITQQQKQMDQWKQPTSQTVTRKALLEFEAVEGRVKEVAAALQKLKLTRVSVEKKDEDHPCDASFSEQTERVCQACEDLSQQVEVLKPALQQTVEDWGCLDRNLKEVSLHATRAHCTLHQRAPLFSLRQAERDRDLLQQLQEKTGKAGEIWASLEKSHQGLVKNLHHGTAQALGDQMEAEKKRWKEVLQELKDEDMKTAETLSLWQQYSQLSDQCSLNLQTLRRRWEDLITSSPQEDTEAVVHSVERLQGAAEDLESNMGDVLSASKPLIGRLQPLAANLIQSETRLLSRDILLLSRAVSSRQKSLQKGLGQQKLFHAHLEAFEEQTQNVQNKLKASSNDTDSVKVLSELSDLYSSLVHIREMAGCMTLNNTETDRLSSVSRQWAETMTHASNRNRELQTEHQRSLSFQEKFESLTTLQKTLEEELMSKKPHSSSSVQEMVTAHQKLEAEMNVGHQLLQALLRHTVESMEKESGEKRSELIDQVTHLRETWLNTVALAGQRRSMIKDKVGKWRVCNHGLRLLQRLLRDIDPLLPPAGLSLCTLHQLQSYADDIQCVEKALGSHSIVYTQTMEAWKHLCDTITESESQSGLRSELQAVQEAWERTTSLLEERRDLVNTTVQKWSQCQEGITGIIADLNTMKNRIQQPRRPQDYEEEKQIQEAELSLQRLSGGLRDLSTMKTDLSQYVAACDSALLEQQLEQLHSQWEELCTKVSLRRQEIADRLNAWTIFNDKNKEFCDWLTQMENKVCHSGELSIEEMVEKLKKDCMEEINLFSENKSHLKQLGEQLLLASDEAKQSQVLGSLQEVNQRWHHLFHHIEARVKKLKDTLVTVQQLDKNMSNLRSWLSRIEAELSRPITYSVCHHQEIQKRLAEQQELQRDIEQHTEGVASVLSLCDVLLRDEDAGGGTEAESDSLHETSRSLDQRWRTICALALDRRLKIEETWGLWCKFLDDYSRFEDWLKMAECTAANPNSADVLYTVAKEELKKFEGFQRQVHERLTQLELVNNQYRRLARENRTDRASQLRAMVHEGNRRWDTLHRRVASILRRLKYFTSQREDFEGTRESMLVWLTELDLQLTNVEHFSESDVHQKIQQLNSFQKEITLNTERIDGLIVFGEGLIQKSSPQDAALIEDELEELHSYCQEVFSRLVRFHQRLSQPPIVEEEPELSSTTFALESSLELIGRPWLGRSQGSFPATPTHLLACGLERSGRETPVSVDSLPLEWDHTGDVGGSSSHEDDEEDEDDDEEGRTYFSALSEVELMESLEEFVEAQEAIQASSVAESVRRRPQGDAETQPLQLDSEGQTEAQPTLTSTPLKPGYLHLMSQCSGSIENIKRVSLILDDEEQPEELGLTGLTPSDKQSGVIERWELLKAQSRSDLHADSQDPQQLTSDLDDITSWLESVVPHLEHLQQSDPAASMEEMAARAKELREMQKTFAHYKSIMLSVNLRAQEVPELQERLSGMNRDWSRACTGLQQWDSSLRKTLIRCQEFHENLHSLLLWLAHAESRRYAVNISNPDTPIRALQQHFSTLTDLQEELQGRQTQQASLQALWSQLQPEEDDSEESEEAREKLHVTGSKLKLLLRQVEQDLGSLQQRLECEPAAEIEGQSASADSSQTPKSSKKGPSPQRERRDLSPPRSFFYRVLRAAFPLHLLLLFLLLLPCLIPISESDPTCSTTNNFARSFYPMLRYTNGPPPT
ncbi:LOW QUALITY PROTEIN: nesprin-2 [Xyrichtys novacula]|uniref:LOW QUALITY PROTEIN: nesprin-2 n=1 Tax=Xyrichtys novacula TaxID=13765 RepID=A0AAV1GYP5_XYRNO|nr:LOW QUALITY PROTEIN: nesprin-2 [Xyrichtys novacula]